jgi:hypothetical protein
LGIFGRSRSEIVNHIIGEEMRRLLQGGLLKREELETEVQHVLRNPVTDGDAGDD